ncbi:DUF4058 family protein [Oscillatoria salina]|uniref:DUF4058 family protein n=1 Tax=Oscillatoria salina TaxID=331517 RepID=UPI0013BB8E6F|nr:DUF4058 family protein [Oscillatoria salina]MBZ8180127.1 DUF4058 family protein [Oscillatoria salina IIICB1]NET90754.1 DUF4058 family protein [Kamptonema sp. SIO1D9]
MPSPFPGMNPYLESPLFWSGFHHWLIIDIARLLSPQLRPKYLVAVEVRTYETSGEDSLLVGLPDVTIKAAQTASKSTKTNVAVATPATKPLTVNLPIPETIKEGYLEIRDVKTKQVITAIELLSPTNKRSGKGREKYLQKRQRILGSSTHLVEIDLLRGGQTMPMDTKGIKSDYRILVSKENRRPQADLYAFNLRETIPEFPLPLRREDSEPVINLQALINQIYDQASFDLQIDYSQPPIPKLTETERTWADDLLQQLGLK